jgi:hypothetical protein
METIVPQKEQERWIIEGNIALFEDQLKLATNEKDRDRLRGMLARERERFSRLSPE